MNNANLLHSNTRAYRFDDGRYFINVPFWSEGKALEDELLKLGYFCGRTYDGGSYAVWQKGREFIFVIHVGSIAWTVEVTGLPNYLQFISEYLGPLLTHGDRLPDAEIKTRQEAKAKEAKAKEAKAKEAKAKEAKTKEATVKEAKVKEAEAEAKPATNVSEMPSVRADPALQTNDVSCLAAIGLIDDRWRQCIGSKDAAQHVNGNAAATVKQPFQLCAPDVPDVPKAAKA